MTMKDTVEVNESRFKDYPQQPHGGKLVDRVLTGEARDEAMERALSLPKIMVDLEAVITLEMIATGVLSPNEGFMVEKDYKSVLENGRLRDRKSTRLNSSHVAISYAVFCLKKKRNTNTVTSS